MARQGRLLLRSVEICLSHGERDSDGGRAEVQRARALDPSYTWPIMFECHIAIARGEYESAQRLAEQVMEVDPHFFYHLDRSRASMRPKVAGRRRPSATKTFPPAP